LSAGVLQAETQTSTNSEKTLLAEIKKIRNVNDEDSQEALRLLKEFSSKVSENSSVELRHQYLDVLATAQTETGALELAMNTFKKLEKLGIDNQNQAIEADGMTGQGSVLVSKGNYKEGIQLFRKAVELAESVPDHKVAQYALNNLALAENTMGDFKIALTHFFEAVEHVKQTGEGQDRRLSMLYNNISLLYLSLKDPDKALDFNHQAFEKAQASGSKGMLATLSTNRGYAFDEIGRTEEAYDAYLNGYQYAKDSHSVRSQAVALINISDSLFRQKRYKESAEQAQQALIFSEKSGEQSYISTAKINIGLALMKSGEVEKGADMVKAAITLFHASKSKLDEADTWKELSQLYAEVGYYKEALEALHNRNTLNDEIFKSDREHAVAKLQEQFDAVSRQKKIELLERENQVKNAEILNKKLQQRVTQLVAILVILVAILVYILYRKVRKTNELLQVANSELEIQSVKDPLTGLYNRRSFLNLMASRNDIDERRNRNTANPDHLVLLDVDNFKHVNDTYGHAAGDAVLVEISKRLTDLMRDSDMVLRWGGEEFLLFIKQPNPQNIPSLVQRILGQIGKEPISTGTEELNITVSAGAIALPFCEMSEAEFSWERALQLADMALYLSKVHGRNRAYCVNKLLAPFDEVSPILEKDLAEAMRRELVEVNLVLGPNNGDIISSTH